METNESEALANTRKDLIFQIRENEKRVAELAIANRELVMQRDEKRKREAELDLANLDVAFRDAEKEKRSGELLIANVELAFQNEEKEKRAAELMIANVELAYQNEEKEKRAAELMIANVELAYQNTEKEKRAAELILANQELLVQHAEKEKRTRELLSMNAELEAFSYISGHDLREPLRKIFTFASIIQDTEKNLSAKGADYFSRILSSASQMQLLMDDLVIFSRLKNDDPQKFKRTDLTLLIREVEKMLAETIAEKTAVIELNLTCEVNIIPFLFRQLIHNLVANALKFSSPDRVPHIIIQSQLVNGRDIKTETLSDHEYCQISVLDNGIGFDPQYRHRIFDVFQRLHGKSKYQGSGIGLAIVRRIVDIHNGVITADGEPGIGATFTIYLPMI